MSAFTTTWNDVATHIKTTYEVEMEWPDAVGFLLPGGRSSHRILLGTNNPGFGGVDYITMDAFLGPTSDVDVIRAAQCAHRLLGGVVVADDVATIRDSRCLATLSIEHLNMSLGYLSGALDAYWFSSQT